MNMQLHRLEHEESCPNDKVLEDGGPDRPQLSPGYSTLSSSGDFQQVTYPLQTSVSSCVNERLHLTSVYG